MKISGRMLETGVKLRPGGIRDRCSITTYVHRTMVADT